MSSGKKSLSRRDFVKGAAVTVAAVAGGSILAGCGGQEATEVALTEVAANTEAAAPTNTSAPAPTALQPTAAPTEVVADETIETQIVVVGSGLGGLAAAITAMEEGATSVVLLEKEVGFGGGTNFAECNGPGEATEEQARASAQSALENSNYIADPMLHYYMALEKKENTDWLFTQHGVKYYQDKGPAFYEGGNGTSCVATLVPQAQDLGVDTRLSTKAVSLLLDDEYTVTGVRAEDEDGKIIDFKAKAVVLATGGMSTNKELLAKYTSIDLEKVIIDGAQSGQDGDGQVMVEATAHGKATHLCVSSLFLNVKGFAYSSPMGVCAGMQPTNLWVNQDAIRFASEACVSSTEACNKAVEIQGSVYSIMDQAGFDAYAAGGCQSHYSGFADKLVGTPIEDLAGDYEQYKDLEDVFQADTLDDLATQMGIDVETFKATVERYNSYLDGGTDTEWGKDVAKIWAISTPPFYGFRLSSGMLNTNGGIRINTNSQVVDPRYKVISGLYAVGIVTSGWQGETYMGGTCQPVALWGGRKAAKHIVANLL